MMETMDQGDVIIRPSSKGENHLTVTWKVSDGIYQHVDIREEGKENAFSLGATLWINSEVRASPFHFTSHSCFQKQAISGCFHLPSVTYAFYISEFFRTTEQEVGCEMTYLIQFCTFCPSFPIL